LSKKDKEKMIDEFKKTTKKAALFGVVSGSFSEGVDLIDNFLEIVVIVGLPLAPLDILIKSQINYFEKKYNKGEEYGYISPSMTKVVQALGRCIRSEKDRGVIVLIDDRFVSPKYSKHLPSHLNLKQSFALKEEIRNFFN